jgi:hypothetical protein
VNHTERLAYAEIAKHRVGCPRCSDADHVLKYGWCITGKRLWRYYMSIKLTKRFER